MTHHANRLAQWLMALPVEDSSAVGLALLLLCIVLAALLVGYVRGHTVQAAEPAPADCTMESVRRVAGALHVVAGEVARSTDPVSPAVLRQLARLARNASDIASGLACAPVTITTDNSLPGGRMEH